MQAVIRIHPSDNVLVTLRELAAGEQIAHEGVSFTLSDPLPRGHKLALVALFEGDQIIKYGLPIGHATRAIAAGEHIHHHNLATNLSDLDEYSYQPELIDVSTALPDREIQVYRRHDGQVGIRNELWILPTVGCVNALAKQMKQQLERDTDLGAIDGVHLFGHQYGCSQLGQDHLNTRTLLQNLVHHPNSGGVLVVGLGCENNQIAAFRETLGPIDAARVRFMVCQQHDDEVEHGLGLLRELLAQMQQDRRQPGRLGLSGITANPLLGCFSDYVIQHGGSSVLTEVPEMFGAERILMSRCQDEQTFDKTVQMVNDFKQYFIDHQQPIYENPSPGNKAGGISTLEEKSLGCTQKAGHSQVVDVLPYGARLQRPGLNLLSAPGNDAVATSALAGAGCHMVLFSTGRGTPYGGPAPTVKLATNSDLARRKPHWIDFNAGTLIEGTPMSSLLAQFIDLIVDIANGKPTCNERNDFRELAIFKSGVTL